VYALARAAASGQDAALFLTAAFAGLRRGELVALRWRDVDFEKRSIRVEGSFSHGAVTTTKGGRVRAVPQSPRWHKRSRASGQRGYATAPGDPVFPGDIAGHLDVSALRRRFVAARDAAGLRPLRFRDMRHTFGSLAINRASIVQVQAWMGHADVKTTMRYLHHRSQQDEAELLADPSHRCDRRQLVRRACGCERRQWFSRGRVAAAGCDCSLAWWLLHKRGASVRAG